MLENRYYGHVDRTILISWECTSKMKLLAAEANKSNQIVWWSLIMRRSRDKIWGHVISHDHFCGQFHEATIQLKMQAILYCNNPLYKGRFSLKIFALNADWTESPVRNLQNAKLLHWKMLVLAKLAATCLQSHHFHMIYMLQNLPR